MKTNLKETISAILYGVQLVFIVLLMWLFNYCCVLYNLFKKSFDCVKHIL